MPHQIPDLPDGWTVATNIEEHISFLYAGGDGRSIAVKPVSPDADRWKAIGVANYAPDAPVFTQYDELGDAIATAVDVMQAVVDGTAGEIEPVKTINCEFTDRDQSDTTDDNSNDSDNDQAALQQFV